MTYVDLGDLAESVRPLGKMSTNVVACRIDYINNHIDVCADKIIVHYSVTCKIWDGDFHHKILRKNFAQHGEFKLTLKKYVSTPPLSALFCHMVWFLAIICTLFMWQMFHAAIAAVQTDYFDFCIPCKLCGNFIEKYTTNFVHTWTATFFQLPPP